MSTSQPFGHNVVPSAVGRENSPDPDDVPIVDLGESRANLIPPTRATFRSGRQTPTRTRGARATASSLIPPTRTTFRSGRQTPTRTRGARAAAGKSPWPGVTGGSPDGIRTRATALRGRRARPLHNGALAWSRSLLTRPRKPTNSLSDGELRVIRLAGVLGLEPRLTEPESVGLPITLYPTSALPPERSRPRGARGATLLQIGRPPQTRCRAFRPRRSRGDSHATDRPGSAACSRCAENSAYASTANRANPPTSKTASSQLISRIAFSAAIEVVRPAMHVRADVVDHVRGDAGLQPAGPPDQNPGQQPESQPVHEQRRVLHAVQQREDHRRDHHAEPRLGDQAAQRLQQVAAEEDLLGHRLQRRGQHDHHQEAPEARLRPEHQVGSPSTRRGQAAPPFSATTAITRQPSR